MSYGVSDFGSMLNDEHRLAAYLGALEDVDVRGKRVLDLGCGTGFFTLRSLADGASEVVAVELLDAVDTLPDVLRANGLADRAVVYKGDVRELGDLGRFDVVITDLRGSTPFFSDHLDVLRWVHEHLLSEDGVLLPSKDTLHFAPASAPEWFDRAWLPWQIDEHDWSLYAAQAVVRPHRLAELGATSLFSAGQPWGEIDYRDRSSLGVRHWSGEASFEATSSGELHGVATWFDAEISPGRTFTTHPSERRPTYGRQLLPILNPIAVTIGEEVRCAVACRRVRSEWVWSWEVETTLCRRAHSTLDSLPLGADGLDRVRNGQKAAEAGRLL